MMRTILAGVLLTTGLLPAITSARRVPTTDGRPNMLVEIQGGQPGDVLESLPRTGTIPKLTLLDSDACFLEGESRRGVPPPGSYVCDVNVDTISLWDHRLQRAEWRSDWTMEVNIGCEFVNASQIPGTSAIYDCPCGIFKSPAGCYDPERLVVPPPGADMDSLAEWHWKRHEAEELVISEELAREHWKRHKKGELPDPGRTTTNVDPTRNSPR